MTTLTSTHTVSTDELARIKHPNVGIVNETGNHDGSFSQLSGPFASYERTVSLVAAGQERHTVTQTIRYQLRMPYVGWIIALPLKRALRPSVPAIDSPRHTPWWAPPDQLDAHTINVLGLLCGASIVGGYLNTLITQSILPASDEFGTSKHTEAIALAVVRIGILISLALATVADRKGRRNAILLCLVAGPIFAALGALSPNLMFLTITQLVSRSFALGLGILIPIFAAEEMPKNSRAYALSMTSLGMAFGAGLCVFSLHLADLGVRGWRLMYVVPLLGLAIAAHMFRKLPESRRFDAHRPDESAAAESPHHRPSLKQNMGRLVMLCVGLALLNVFVAPASQLQNRYLNNERGFTKGDISNFTLLTNTPGGIGVAVGGKLADAYGRRIVGAVAVAALGICTTASYFASGVWLWLWAAVGAIIGSATIPSLSVYLPELFPTALRGKANGIISTVAVMGSAIGLITVGYLSDRWGRVGPAIAIMCIGPLVLAALVILKFPETAHKELEQLNPQDAELASTPGG